jgi:glyoxylase-like metal-dependent hydrolase (beta-lactamase superfamily II)
MQCRRIEIALLWVAPPANSTSLPTPVVNDTMTTPHVIDLGFQGTPGVIASFVLSTNGELGIVETGPTSTLPNLLAGLERFGGIERLTTIAVTHIHLDHAGAVGRLLELAPQARCYVHTVGRRHLVDPSRLIRSATMIYGDRMDSLWGSVLPAPADRVIGVGDGDAVVVGGVELSVLYTPGHAKHHIALFDGKTNRMFTGDVAGVKLLKVDQVRPPTPPPDLDPTAWLQSVQHMRGVKPRELWLTHFGPVTTGIDSHFDELLSRLDSWVELVTAARNAGQDRDTIVAELERATNVEALSAGGSRENIHQFDLATPFGMTVDGILHYLQSQ